MSIQEDLVKLRADVRAQSPDELTLALDKSVNELKASPPHKISVGEAAPNFRLTDATGKVISLSNALRNGPVVLNFYRGGWCPFCNLELHALQRSLPKFKELGAQLIAISPEAPDNSLTTIQKHKLEFPVLSDLKCDVANQYGIVYTVPEYLRTTFEKFGLDLKKHNATDKLQLPIPATYVIDTNQVIQFAFANEDFTERADVEEIIKVLKRIKPKH